MAFDFAEFRANAAVYMAQAGRVFEPVPDEGIEDPERRARLFEQAQQISAKAKAASLHEMGMRTAVIFASEAFADELGPADFPGGLSVEQLLERAQTRIKGGDAENLARAGLLLLAAGVVKMGE